MRDFVEYRRAEAPETNAADVSEYGLSRAVRTAGAAPHMQAAHWLAGAIALTGLREQMADRRWILRAGGGHPFANAVHRILASRWLAAVGDSGQAARLRLWHEADIPNQTYPMEEMNQALWNAAYH